MDRKEKMDRITAMLKEGVEQVFSSEQYTLWLKTMGKFHHYSLNNQILILMQTGGTASHVAGYRKWQTLGRQVRKGEKGIWIISPIFKFKPALAILLFTIINLSIAPLVNKKVVSTTIQTDENTSEEIKWATANCAKYKDLKDDEDDEDKKKLIQSEIDACERIKTMHDMEYASFIFDIVIGFVCGLLGLFHLFDIRTNFISITGLIGLGCGVVGFVLSFVYVIYNGLVFTNKYSGVIGRESEGYFAERNGISGTTEYRCIDSDDKDNIF